MNDRQKENFQQQLLDNASSVVKDFLTEAKYNIVRQEYVRHFDEIESIVNSYKPNFRICAEDIGNLSPIIKAHIFEDFLFFKYLHRAICEGILTKTMITNN